MYLGSILVWHFDFRKIIFALSLGFLVYKNRDSCSISLDCCKDKYLEHRTFPLLLLFSSSVMSNSCYPLPAAPGFPVLHYLLEFAHTHVHWVKDDIHPSHPLLPHYPLALSLSSFRVFSNESALCIRWPKYWSFRFPLLALGYCNVTRWPSD